MMAPEDPEAILRVDCPAWCINRRPADEHGHHATVVGTVAAQDAEVDVDLWQNVGAAVAFVQMTAGSGEVDAGSRSVYLLPLQAEWLGRRLIEAARILREAAGR